MSNFINLTVLFGNLSIFIYITKKEDYMTKKVMQKIYFIIINIKIKMVYFKISYIFYFAQPMYYNV